MKVGVITGGHAFDVIGFHRLFRCFGELDCYIQPLEEWAIDYHRFGARYEVLVFYNMHTDPPEDCPGGKRTREAIDNLGDGTGIVVLHHGILAFKQDAVWDAIVGIMERTIDDYSHDERLKVHIAEESHPITEGLDDWTLIDETYDFRNVEGDDSTVLLTVDHPHSISTMAWTRRYRESRVLNLVFGHDDQAWSDEQFREVLGRGIAWCGRKL
jgi:uncharacterized protein